MKPWIATRLRYLADRIDPSSGPRLFTTYKFKYVYRKGIVFDPTVGCPLWYMAEDYEQAFDPTGNPWPEKVQLGPKCLMDGER